MHRLSPEQVARCRYCLVLSADAFITAQLLDAGADVRCTVARYDLLYSRQDNRRDKGRGRA